MHFLCQILGIACFLLLRHLGSCTEIDPRKLIARLDMDEARECVHKILHCTPKYTSVCIDSDELFESMHHLETVCRLNSDFIECLENAKTFCVERNIEPVEVLMLKNKLWTRELCKEDSKWKIEYIKYAPCLNRELPATAYRCNLEFPLPAVQAGMTALCRYLDGLMNCKSKILVQKCGETAANLFRHIALLNGGREYLCRKHQGTVDPNSPMMIAAQMLNSFRNFMNNFSIIIRDGMIPDVADDILKEVDARNLKFENPFDTQEFVKMFEDVLPMDFVKPDIDELNGKDDIEDFGPEIVFKTKSQIDPILELVEPQVEQDIKIPEDGLMGLRTEQEHPLSNEANGVTKFRTDEVDPESDGVVDGSMEDSFSCNQFDDWDIPTFQSNASIHVFLITNRGVKRHLGFGQTMVNWKRFQNVPLNDLFCSWMVEGSSQRMFRCAVELEELKSKQSEEKLRIRPVILSLYSYPKGMALSGELLLTRMVAICLQDFQNSEGISIEEEDMAYPLKSTLKEFMHDQYAERSGELWNDADSVKVIEDGISESKPKYIILEGNNSLHPIPESYSEGSMELDEKEIPQDGSENEAASQLDVNVSYTTPDGNEYQVDETNPDENEYQVDEENTFDSADVGVEGTHFLHHNLESYLLEQNVKEIPQEESENEVSVPLDAQVSYISSDEAEGNRRNKNKRSESEENNSLHHNPEPHSIEQASKEIKQDGSDHEADDSLDANVIGSPDECKIPEQRTASDDKLSSLSDAVDKHHSMYSYIKVPVEGSFEFGHNPPQNCKTESTSDPPKECFQIKSHPFRLESTQCPDGPMAFNTNDMTGMYIDARNIGTIDPFTRTSDQYNEKHPYNVDPDVNYILKGFPYIPSSEDNIYYVTPSTKTLPVYSTRTVSAQIIEDEIGNIYAEEEHF